jgi:hypothetical protein
MGQETCERSQSIPNTDVHLDRPGGASIHPVYAFTGKDKVIISYISRARDVGDPGTLDRNVAAARSRDQMGGIHRPRRSNDNEAARLATDHKHVSLSSLIGQDGHWWHPAGRGSKGRTAENRQPCAQHSGNPDHAQVSFTDIGLHRAPRGIHRQCRSDIGL